jgi:hypothetical protein
MFVPPLFTSSLLPIYGAFLFLLLLLVFHDETPNSAGGGRFGIKAAIETLIFIGVLLWGWSLYGNNLLRLLGPMVGQPITPQSIATLSLFGAVVMTGIGLLPIMAFYVRGWQIRHDDIRNSLDDQAIERYVRTFLYNAKRDKESHVQIFDRMYTTRYGRYRLREPIILLIAVLLPLSTLASHTALTRLMAYEHVGYTTPTLVLPAEALAAVTGAYSFVVANLVWAALSYNLPPLVLVNAALRLLVAAPLGYAVASVGGGHSELLAFAAGAWPLGWFQTQFRRLTNNYLLNAGANAPGGADASPTDSAITLDGVDRQVAENLAGAQISTVAQLAYCDPVQISLRTNITFDVIIDLQSEALAAIYLGDKLDALRLMGLRGAIEIAGLWALQDSAETSPQFDKTFAAAQQAAGIAAGGFRNCLREIALDPYTQFLVAVWQFRDAQQESKATGQAGHSVSCSAI